MNSPHSILSAGGVGLLLAIADDIDSWQKANSKAEKRLPYEWRIAIPTYIKGAARAILALFIGTTTTGVNL